MEEDFTTVKIERSETTREAGRVGREKEGEDGKGKDGLKSMLVVQGEMRVRKRSTVSVRKPHPHKYIHQYQICSVYGLPP